VNTHSCSPARCIPSSAAGRLLQALLHPELSRPAPHPMVAQGSKRHYRCLHMHRTNPAGGYKVTHEK
jgi:hypothetical protein